MSEENKGFMSNFGLMIPQEPFKMPPKKKISRWKRFLCATIGHKWGFAGISYSGPSFPRKCSRCKKTKWFDKPTLRMRFEEWLGKTLDKLLRPFCIIGLHHWKSLYGFSSFVIGGDGKSESGAVYKCPRCKKTKTVNS